MYGVARTAPAVDTVAGALVDEAGRVTAVVEEGRVVVPGADSLDEGPGSTGIPEEDAGGATGCPEDGTGITGGTPVSAGGTGGALVVGVGASGGGLKGAVTVDSTEVAGGGREDGTSYEDAGAVGTGRPGVPHSLTVTVTVTAGTQAEAHVSFGCTEQSIGANLLS